MVKNATENLEERLDIGLGSLEEGLKNGLEKIQAQTMDSIRELDTRISAQVAAIAIPSIPDNLDQTLSEIYEALPGEEDWQGLVADLAGVIEQRLASLEGVRQKALYEWMNANEKAFAGLDEESQAAQLMNLDLASQALAELAQLKMSPAQAKKTPFMAMALNLGRTGAAQALINMRQRSQQGGNDGYDYGNQRPQVGIR